MGGVLEAVIGYGIGLAVLGAVLAYAVRGYRKLRSDDANQLARKDANRPNVSDSTHYVRTLPGPAVYPMDSRGTQSNRAGLSGPYDFDQQH